MYKVKYLRTFLKMDNKLKVNKKKNVKLWRYNMTVKLKILTKIMKIIYKMMLAVLVNKITKNKMKI